MDAQAPRVLACVDQSHYAEAVADHAVWAASRLQAPLEFLHVIDRHPERSSGGDHSGAIGIDAQENLLSQLSAEDEARARSARERGRVFLNALKERAVAAGAPSVDVRQRYGDLQSTLTEQAGDAGLLVLGRRGEAAANTRRDLGRNLERVVRALKKPILTVTEHFSAPRRVMIAYDGGAVTRRGVETLAASPLLQGLPIELLMSGKPRQDAASKLEWARARLVQAGLDVSTALIEGDAETVIASQVRARSIDLLVMGAYSHSPLRSLLFGSKTTELLRAAIIPTLLLR